MIDRKWLLKNYVDEKKSYWLDRIIYKNPLECWIYQDIIFNKQPDVIIETGTASGGSALFFASICELLDHGRVITIDIQESDTNIQTKYKCGERITILKGVSMSAEIIDEVKKLIKPNEKVMVSLDSDHNAPNVFSELVFYAPIVTEGQYMVVEDTYQGGPKEAIKSFLEINKDFRIDRDVEWGEESFNSGGYLLKIKN